ncbi:DUF4393 domain-containing protein [Curtobacterium flaccumfaciens]|uniref:DUF4393 domain-containing protein n=1 Tax=Curtobacterium flaccumfaciens TaxID=2035 RepID=UPI003991F9AE
MTGLEAAAGAAAVGVAKNATKGALQAKREQKRDEQKALLEAAKDTEEFKAAARIKGNKIAVKEALGLIIMKPLAGIMGISREYFQTQFAADYAEKIADVPDEHLQTPKASVAGPAFEGLAYSLDEPELKDMYLELLARASDDRVASSAHPSFVQLIRELSAEEARYLPIYLSAPNQMAAIVQYRAEFYPKPDNGYRVVYSHVLDIREEDDSPTYDPMIPTYVDNWVRLKLVEVQYDAALTASGAYDWVNGRPEASVAQSRLADIKTPAFDAVVAQRGISDVLLETQNGVLTSTAFGHQFAVAAGMV